MQLVECEMNVFEKERGEAENHVCPQNDHVYAQSTVSTLSTLILFGDARKL